jgi:hypothetical protein
VSVVAAAAALLPLALITLRLSAHNVAWVTAIASGNEPPGNLGILVRAMAAQMSWPIVGLAVIGTLRAVATRDVRSVLFILWVTAFVALVLFVTKSVDADRYTIYWVPALCTLAASGVTGWSSRAVRTIASGLLILSLGWEAVAAWRVQLDGAGGYEEAARYVVRETPGPASILFSGDVDTGYFVFFVRKHDPNRRLVVLRANKILTTSYMSNVAFKEQIQKPEQIDAILNKFGTRFIVIEDRPSTSHVLEWLRSRLRRAPYIERLRVPLRSSNPRLKNVDLVVFENVGVPPPHTDAKMRLDLPLGGLVIDVRMGDVLAGPGRRE